MLVTLSLAFLASPTLPQNAPRTPPPAVVVQRVEVQPVRDPSEYVARVEAIEAVDVRARVQGFLQTVAFEAGQTVAAGEVLFEIEPDRYQAGVASAQAQLSRAEAARQEAERTLARTQELAERQQVAQAALDEARAAFEMAEADVEVARAALRSAELDLSYTRITAPIAGQIGLAVFSVGNLVGPESGALARLVQLDPIRVVFSVPEGMVVTLRQEAAKRGGAIDPNALRLSLRLPNDTEYQRPGRIEYVETEVNPQTGTVAVRVVFPNPDRLLLPNQFVTLSVGEETVPRLPVVPQSAVLQDRQGRYVFLLGDDDTVSRRRIETGARVETGWAVTEGLGGGESVVVRGVQRLSEGARVTPAQEQPVEDAP